jgi:Zn-dependent protease with chaperone function/Zn-finger nucleic acid-binding protein
MDIHEGKEITTGAAVLPSKGPGPKAGLQPEAASFTMIPMNPPLDFYELEKRQKIRSLAVLGVLFLFHLAAVGLLLLAGLMTIGLLSPRLAVFGPGFLLKFAAADVILALMIALFQYFDARKNGAAFLIKRLSAAPPDLSDRYHHLFADAVSAVGLAAGLSRVDALILPSFSLNSLALIQPDGRPAVLVTEGLLADCSRDEVESVVAHEMGHIVRGDTTILTLVCGITSFFERLRDSLEPETDENPPDFLRRRNSGSSSGFLYVAAALSAVIIRLLAIFVSREREDLADAEAVELGRSPAALARAIYKAQTRNVFIGDFSESYAPLFLIAPQTAGEADAPGPHWPSTHPPFEERIKQLADMAHLTLQVISEQVRDEGEARKKARAITIEAAANPALSPAIPAASAEPKEWALVLPGGGLTTPMILGDMIEAEGFKPMGRVKNLPEGLEARAQDFPQVRDALRRRRQGRPVEMAVLGKCPRCGIPLGDSDYEGVPIKVCRRCGGRLVGREIMNRIIARREIGFSDELVKKADAFRKEFLLNPAVRAKPVDLASGHLTCPGCGCPMRPRPYNYQYFIPVDKCDSCGRIWFDADELEILQILIEETRTD